jgi:hypothetical protein
MSRGFVFACDMFKLGRIAFTHEPMVVVPDDVDFNAHGHLHDNTHRLFEPGPKHRLVAIERTDYAPVLVEKAIRVCCTAVKPTAVTGRGGHVSPG